MSHKNIAIKSGLILGFLDTNIESQVEDGVSIHWKCGTRDKVLYSFTQFLHIWGLTECGIYYYHSALSAKPAPAIDEQSAEPEAEAEAKPKNKCN